VNGGSHKKGGKPQLSASREEESHECHARNCVPTLSKARLFRPEMK
jgi:hypothetical protein